MVVAPSVGLEMSAAQLGKPLESKADVVNGTRSLDEVEEILSGSEGNGEEVVVQLFRYRTASGS